MKKNTTTANAPLAWAVRDSHIHGTGVFAARAIAAGEKILEYKGRRITKTESLRCADERKKSGDDRVFIFTLNSRFDLDGDVPENAARFVNHSCGENCEMVLVRGRLWLVARRDIAAGDELTFDYGFGIENFFEHPCRCGSPHCVGYIVNAPDRPKLRRLLSRSKRRTCGNTSA